MLNAFLATGEALLRHRFSPLLSPYLPDVKKDFLPTLQPPGIRTKCARTFREVPTRSLVITTPKNVDLWKKPPPDPTPVFTTIPHLQQRQQIYNRRLSFPILFAIINNTAIPTITRKREIKTKMIFSIK